MKIKYHLLMLAATLFGCKEIKQRPSDSVATSSSFYSLKAKSLDGNQIDFSKFKGKKVLIVNTASKCGYTPQYSDLQKLQNTYKDQLVVLGFPCNQFGEQEPGNSSEIDDFCKKNYGVSFQMFDKGDVKGENKQVIYKWLTDKNLNGWNEQEPTWNFCKYLINEKGELVKYYPSNISPMAKSITELL